VYAQVDGNTPIGTITDALGLSNAEAFAVVQQLQAHNLITESVLTYSAFQHSQDTDAQDASASETDSAHTSPVERADTLTGAASDNGSTDHPAQEEHHDTSSDARGLDLPQLWNWIEETTDNQKDYKNTQAFVLLEAADALSRVGITNMEDLHTTRVCDDEEAVEALESAIERNMGVTIPEHCYDVPA
jgi:hypothetical protein